MPSIKNFLKEAFSSSASALHRDNGHSPEFDAEREKWQKESTHDVVLADFTKYLQKGTPNWGPAFKPKEFETLEKAFAAHANSEKLWDKNSLESYLRTQTPEDENSQTLLANSIPALWSLAVYFAQWPFNTVFGPTTSLDFPAFVRSVAFLSGRHYRLFKSWSNKDGSFNRKTDQPVLEYIFRALATPQPAEQPSVSGTAKSTSQRDVLDILSVSQPVLNEATQTLTRDELTPTADRLAPPTPPELSDLSIPATEKKLIPLLELSISLLQQASKFDTSRSPTLLKESLEASKEELQKLDEVSFDLFSKLLDSDEWVEKRNAVDTIYDGIALLFNTFPNPQSLRTGKTVNWSSGAEETLYLGSLRNLGLTRS